MNIKPHYIHMCLSKPNKRIAETKILCASGSVPTTTTQNAQLHWKSPRIATGITNNGRSGVVDLVGCLQCTKKINKNRTLRFYKRQTYSQTECSQNTNEERECMWMECTMAGMSREDAENFTTGLAIQWSAIWKWPGIIVVIYSFIRWNILMCCKDMYLN